MAETLIILRLGVPPVADAPLDQPDRVHDRDLPEHSKNVKRWRDGTMTLRWCAAGMLEADHQFRRVNGRLPMPEPRAAGSFVIRSLNRPDLLVRMPVGHRH
jgi:hypothetical protein